MIEKILSKILSTFFPASCYLCKKEGDSICHACLKQSMKCYDSPSPNITSIYSFKDPSIKKIIHAIKYFHRKDLIPPITEALALEIEKMDHASLTLVPIPMPTVRKYIRGYNHCEAIASVLSRRTSVAMSTTLLLRASTKKRQVEARSRRERLLNQHDAFMVSSDVRGMNILLIDDVSTTGATLIEARKVLLVSGARSVSSLTIAH